jgi:hypothetical protein
MSAANPNLMEISMVSVLVVANAGGGVAVAVWCAQILAVGTDLIPSFFLLNIFNECHPICKLYTIPCSLIPLSLPLDLI